MARLKAFLKDDSGLELSEYAIMAGIVILVAVLTIISIANHIDAIFNNLDDNLNTAEVAYTPVP